MKPIHLGVTIILLFAVIPSYARATIHAEVQLVPGISFRKELKKLNSIEYASAFAKGNASVSAAPAGELCNGQDPCPSSIHIKKIYDCSGETCYPVKGIYEGRTPF